MILMKIVSSLFELVLIAHLGYCFLLNVKLKPIKLFSKNAILHVVYKSVPYETLIQDVVDRKVTTTLNITLNNNYYGLRHGESEANAMKIISSNPDIGTVTHNLTNLGQIQSIQSSEYIINLFRSKNISWDDIVFISSPFLRAYYTAVFCIQAINDKLKDSIEYKNKKIDINIDNSIRERYFGEFDGKDLLYYNRVWAVDMIDGTNKRHNVESIQEVTDRIYEFILRTESFYKNKTIILVSHGDTLQIAHMLLSKSESRLFSQYRIKNGEVRYLQELTQEPVPIQYI